MDEKYFEEDQQRIQKALNESKKRQLEAKYGAQFSEESAGISPALESEWLTNIEEFERQFEHARRVKVREFLDNPAFKPVDEIAPGRLESEIENVLELLSQRHIVVDSVAGAAPEEYYRFLTTELMDVEIDDVRIDRMNHCFIYEEFHPNDEYDAKQSAEQFMGGLFEREFDRTHQMFSTDEICNSAGTKIDRDQMAQFLREFYGEYLTFTESHHEVCDCNVNAEHAEITLQSHWSGMQASTQKAISYSGNSTLRMKKSPHGGFDITQAIVVGWNHSQG